MKQNNKITPQPSASATLEAVATHTAEPSFARSFLEEGEGGAIEAEHLCVFFSSFFWRAVF